MPPAAEGGAAPSPFEMAAPADPAAAAPSPFAAAPEADAAPPSPFAAAGADAPPSPFAEAQPPAPAEPAAPAAEAGAPPAAGVFDAVAPPPAGPDQQGVTPADDNASKGFVPLSALPAGDQPSKAAEEGEAAGLEAAGNEISAQNPFAAAPPEPVESPFAAGAPAIPADAPPALEGAAEGFPAAGQPLPADAGFAPDQPLAPAAAAPEMPESIELPLSTVLSNVPQPSLGFDPAQVPPEVTARLDTAALAPQLGAGEVTLPLATIVESVAEQYRAAFERTDPQLQVQLPAEALAGAIPEGAAPAVPPPPSEAPPMFEEIAPAEAAAPDPAPIAEGTPLSPFSESPPADAPAIDTPPDSGFAAGAPLTPSEGGESPFGQAAPDAPPAFGETPAPGTPSPEADPAAAPPAFGEDAAPAFGEPATPPPLAEAEQPPQPSPFGALEPEQASSPFAEAPPAETAPEPAAPQAPPEAPTPAEPLPFGDGAMPAPELPDASGDSLPNPAHPAAPKPPEKEEAFQPIASLSPFEAPFDTRGKEPPGETETGFAPSPEPEPGGGDGDIAPAAELPTVAGEPSDATAEPLPAGQPAFGQAEPDPAPPAEPESALPPADAAWAFGDLPPSSGGASPQGDLQPLESLSPLTDQLPAASPAIGEGESGFGQPEGALAPFPDAAAEESAPTDPPAEKPPTFDPVSPPAAEADSAPAFGGATFNDAPEQSTLRALFMSDGAFDPPAIIDHCAQLPGISECVALTADGKLQASSCPDGALGRDAPALLESLRALTSALGADEGGPLTIRSKQGLVSFFSKGGACIGVLHGEEGFKPGVQERLSLVVRELSELVSS